MSSLSWIDFDEAERERNRRILALFNEKDTRDELGLGSIRDSIADHLFPGTSTIQTRLRYMLFVPWICRLVEQRNADSAQLTTEARGLEIRLIDALREGGEEEGIIGREAGATLKRLPSAIYWAGLRAWGVRIFVGSQDSYFATLPALRRHRRSEPDAEGDDMIVADSATTTWHPGLPDPPSDFTKKVDFDLTRGEAGFLLDRLVASHPASLLTFLARAGRKAKCDYIWLHPNLTSFPHETRDLVTDAERFSMLMHGAALLYNLLLAEECRNKDAVEQYRGRLAEWHANLDRPALAAWPLTGFWMRTAHESHRVLDSTRRFVARWLELVTSGQDMSVSKQARDLIRSREMRIKMTNSRFVNASMLSRWGGSSGASRLGFRWDQASGYVNDIADAR